MTEQTRYEVRAAALALRAALLTADGDDTEAAADARLRLPDLRAAVDAARDAALDPDPPEPPLPELLPDVAAVDALLADDDPVTWFDRRAAALGGGASEAAALRRVLAAADRGETAPADLVELAERDLARRERSARRLVRAAQLEADAAAASGESGENLRKQLRAARTALTEARTMRRKVAGARVGATPVAVPDVTECRPERLLSAAGKGGALLTVGNLLVLAGEGGIAKSPLSLAVALGMADRHARRQTHGGPRTGAAIEAGGYGDLHGGLFEGAGGPALIVTYEDTAGDVAYRLRTLAGKWWPTGDRARAALANVHVLAGVGPLFGPAPSQDGEGPAFYNARPGPLDGWADLWRGASGIDGLRLVVIDPAMAAYVGNANDPGPVREFYGALAERAAALQLGVLLVAHTNKASRTNRSSQKPDVYDPGAVSGSTHWTDAARGALHLAYDPDDDDRAGARVLAVSKANYGPSRIRVDLDPVRDKYGEICGFGADGGWHKGAAKPDDAEPADKRNGARPLALIP